MKKLILLAPLILASATAHSSILNPWNDYVDRVIGGMTDIDLLSYPEMGIAGPYFYLTSSASCDKDNFCDYLIYQQKPDGSYGFVDKATYPRLANYKSQHLTAQYAPFSYDINLNNQLDKMKILSIQVSGSGILVPEQTKVDLTGVNCKMINGAEGQGFLPVMKGGSWDIAISKSCEKGVLTISDIETGQILDQWQI